MKQILARILAFIFGAPGTSASEDVAVILSTFTSMADKLAAASAKAVEEIESSYARVDAAWEAYQATDVAELPVREAARDAQRAAENAAQKIRALVS